MEAEVRPGSEYAQVERTRLGSAMRLLGDISAESTVIGSPPDPLILSFVSSVSVEPVSRDLRAELRYATTDAAPPDDVHRSISFNSIAQALHLPFETVRRRVHGLVERGLLVQTAGGVMQNAAAVSQPAYLALAIRRHDRLRRFYFDLHDAGALPQLSRGIRSAVEPVGAPVRIANRVLGEYALRSLQDLGAWLGGVMNACIVLQIAAICGRPDLLAVDRACETDHCKRITDFAGPLHLAAETARRRLHDLIERGAVLRTPQGFTLAQRPLSAQHELIFRANQGRDLRRLFERLDRLGVLDVWARERSHLPTRAHA